MESLIALRSEMVWVQRALEDKLLTPSAKLRRAHAKFLEGEGPRGLTRVLRGVRPGGQEINSLSVRGGGAYFSFASGSHSYNDQPDLSFRGGGLSSGFYGGQTGYVISLGERSLASIGDTVEQSPIGLDETQALAWRLLWSDLRDEEDPDRHAAPPELRKLRGYLQPKGHGELFLLRFFSADEHEHLVAFEVLDLDEYGCTILWRILKTWEVPEPSPAPKAPAKAILAAPESFVKELASMNLDRLFQQLEDVGESAARHLFSVPENLVADYDAKLGESAELIGRRGVVRILNRGAYPVLALVRGHGAYYSFAAGSHDYNQDPDIELQHGRFSSGFAGGDEGYFVDLGVLGARPLRRAAQRQDPAASPEITERWNWLTQLTPVQKGSRWSLQPIDQRRALGLQVKDSAAVHVGHSYLLRTASYSDKDHESVFTVLTASEDSCIIAWHLVHQHAR